MPAYITIAELEARSDARTVAELSNDSNSTSRNDAAINTAIADACDLVDAKLRCRKTVPLAVVDAIIKRITADLALVGLAKRRGEISETLKERERGAVELLDSIAKGDLQISAPDVVKVNGVNLRPKIGRDETKPFAGGRTVTQQISIIPGYGSPFWDALGQCLVSQVRQRFVRGGDDDITWKAPALRGGAPLRHTGILMNSITSRVVSIAPSAGCVAVGTAMIYAAVHQFGATIVPKRAKALFIPLTPLARRIGPQPRGARTTTVVTRSGREISRPTLKYGVDFILTGSVTIPARPFLRMTPANVIAIKAFVARELPRFAS